MASGTAEPEPSAGIAHKSGETLSDSSVTASALDAESWPAPKESIPFVPASADKAQQGTMNVVRFVLFAW